MERVDVKMGKSGFDVSGLKKFQKELEKLKEQAAPFAEDCTKELSARFLAKVIKRTPVGDYRKVIQVTAKKDSKKHKKGDTYTKKVNLSGKLGGTLRRGWISKTQAEAEGGKGKPQAPEIIEYAKSLKISHNGKTLTVTLVNPVEYASYVEYGHVQTPGRYVPALGKKLKKGFVQGHFMLEKSRQEVEKIAPKVIEDKLNKFLGGAFK